MNRNKIRKGVADYICMMVQQNLHGLILFIDTSMIKRCPEAIVYVNRYSF